MGQIFFELFAFVLAFIMVGLLFAICLSFLVLGYFASLVAIGTPYKRWLARRNGVEPSTLAVVVSGVADGIVTILIAATVESTEWLGSCLPDQFWWLKLGFAVILAGIATTVINRSIFSRSTNSQITWWLAARLTLVPQLVFWFALAPLLWMIVIDHLGPGLVELWKIIVQLLESLVPS